MDQKVHTNEYSLFRTLAIPLADPHAILFFYLNTPENIVSLFLTRNTFKSVPLCLPSLQVCLAWGPCNSKQDRMANMAKGAAIKALHKAQICQAFTALEGSL